MTAEDTSISESQNFSVCSTSTQCSKRLEPGDVRQEASHRPGSRGGGDKGIWDINGLVVAVRFSLSADPSLWSLAEATEFITMQLNRVWGLALLLPLVAAAPQGGPPPGAPPVPPTVNNMTMFGTGCPIGGGAISQVTRNNTPVFVFREWGIVLPSEESEETGTSFKWCNEDIILGNGPVGMRLRIAGVTVGGWAELDAGTKISLQVDTRLGGVEAGVSTLD